MFSRTSRILLVIALLLMGAYLLIERPYEHKSDTSGDGDDRVMSFNIADIDSIVLERPDNTVRFAKTDSLWRMIDPLFDAAEPGAIGTLLDALSTADIDRNLGPVKNLTPYGLDHPDAVITLAAAHRVVAQLAVGRNTVDDAWCYARSASGDILLVPTDVHHASTRPLDAYRDHRVVNFQLPDVSSYTLTTNDGQSMHWFRHRHGWSAVESAADTVAGDSVGVEAVLRRLRGLRVASFVSPDDHERVQEVGTVTLAGTEATRKNRTSIARLIFARTPNGPWRVTDTLNGRVVGIDDDVSDLFAHTVTELRDRRLLQFDPERAQHITFSSPARAGEIVRSGGHWSFPNPALGRVDPERAADFVRALRALKWSAPGGEAARTGAHAQYRIEIKGPRDTMIDQLTAGPYDASTRWVSTRSSHGTWLVGVAALDELSHRFARITER